MPLEGVSYRVKKTKNGKKIRLAFRGNQVVEAKNLKTGKIHTEKEFAKDRKKRAMKQIKKKGFRERSSKGM
jgi:hypothetical protein